MLNPFIILISDIIHLYSLIVFIWAILGLLISFEIINRYNQIVSKVYYALTRLVEPALKPIRRVLNRILPDLGGIDLSPIALILLLQFFQNALQAWFYTAPHAVI